MRPNSRVRPFGHIYFALRSCYVIPFQNNSSATYFWATTHFLPSSFHSRRISQILNRYDKLNAAFPPTQEFDLLRGAFSKSWPFSPSVVFSDSSQSRSNSAERRTAPILLANPHEPLDPCIGTLPRRFYPCVRQVTVWYSTHQCSPLNCYRRLDQRVRVSRSSS
jgi:hypothetical protein